MKICFIGDIRSIHTRKWVGFFPSIHEVHLITFDYPEDRDRVLDGEHFFNGLGVKLYKIKKSFPDLLLSPLIARQIIRKINPDIVHAHFVTQYGFFGATSGVRPLVITAWGDDVLIHPTRSILYRFIVRYALKKADLITCDGDNTEKAMIDLGIAGSKIKRIFFGVDTKKFSPEKKNLNLFKSKFEASGEKFIIYLRGFDPVYNTDTLIESIPLVLEKYPNVKFLLAGGGEQLESIKQKVSSSFFNDRVIFLGRIPNDELPSYVATSDVYVSTSLSDSGIAASTAESMACGTPVISTDCGDIRLWIEDEICGYVIEKENPTMLADRIVSLLENETTRKQFGARCREIIVSKQDYYKEMNKMNKIYSDLAGEKCV
jgi:glycosyltransferase involved in cell wall biosynthesis